MKYKENTKKPDDNNSKDTVKGLEKSMASDGGGPMQFGLKMKSRSDDYIPIYNSYKS